MLLADRFNLLGHIKDFWEVLGLKSGRNNQRSQTDNWWNSILRNGPTEVIFLKIIRRFLKWIIRLGTIILIRATKSTNRPVINPLASGLYATMVTPSSRAVLRRLVVSDSISRTNGEYSICSAAIGCTAWARRRSSALHSDRPRYLTLPSLIQWCQVELSNRYSVIEWNAYLTSSAIAPTVISIGTLESGLWSMRFPRYR